MTKNEKEIIRIKYMENEKKETKQTTEELTSEIYEEIKKENEDEGKTKEAIKQCIFKLREIIDETDEEKNPIMFGIELEYAGYDTDVRSSLIEERKNDSSVNGDGLEINLKPVLRTEDNIKKFRNKAEKMMLSAIQNDCQVDYSAGMHIHMSSNSISDFDGEIIDDIFEDVSRMPHLDKDTTKRVVHITEDKEVEEVTESYILNEIDDDYIDQYKKITGRETLELKENAILTIKEKERLEWMRFLYLTSEREGFEPYGLNADGTQGYTLHHTIELRCWRTTLDFRKLTARVTIASFWLYYVLRMTRLAEEGFIDWENINIWEELNKKENEKVKDAYEYLVFNCDNYLEVGGHTLDELYTLLKTNKQMKEEINRRSKMIKESLFNFYPKAVKELFKNV